MSGLLLNLGSGQKPYPKPWINIDKQVRWAPDVIADGSCMPMFEDSSAEVIVIEHTLEHYGCGEGKAMLQECYRILMPGGSLIVTVPDIRQLVKGWVTGRLTTQVFLTSIYGAFMGDQADRHAWGFVPETLEELLYDVAKWGAVNPYEGRPIAGSLTSSDWWILSRRAIK